MATKKKLVSFFITPFRAVSQSIGARSETERYLAPASYPSMCFGKQGHALRDDVAYVRRRHYASIF
ncbi:hypothetical protein AA15669_0840 [Saccharibacter floricola DSM 15669]|uniref:Uncharacterized protein n=1 Tax=Saccharibacter floricola DSM 15669 TaxID=1123227 RepID=A0ABQ0P1I2_9PROT|nr:hypothetical protein AA15669_0840 [Saccharibacter floricola DSM 15669]